MNATTSVDFIQGNGNGSDSDTNSDESPEYYQPISSVEDGNSEGENEGEFHQLPNGYCDDDVAENGISYLDLNSEDGVEQKSSDEEGEEEEEREEERRMRMGEAENRRRNEPMTAENASRVREAMRGVSFVGVVPDWANEVSEDRWIDQLRRLRQSPNN